MYDTHSRPGVAPGDRAISPVVGVALVVALTVVLATVVSATALGFGTLAAPTPTARFTFDHDERAGLVVTHDGGRAIPAAELAIAGEDPDGVAAFGPWAAAGTVGAGDATTLTGVDGDEVVRVVWSRDGRSAVLAEVELRFKSAFAFELTDGTATIAASEFTSRAAGVGADAEHDWTEATDANGDTYVVAGPNDDDNTGLEATGPRVDYRVRFDEPGIYHVWVQLRATTNRDDSVHVGLDGQLASGADHSTSGNYGVTLTRQDGEWRWTDTTDLGRNDRVTVEVTEPGIHTVNVWMREPGVQMKQVVVTRDPGHVP
jgi:flagellin-like protein